MRWEVVHNGPLFRVIGAVARQEAHRGDDMAAELAELVALVADAAVTR